MANQFITIVMNGRTYRLSADHGDAIRYIDAADKLELIALLEEIKLQNSLSEVAVAKAISSSLAYSQRDIKKPAINTTHEASSSAERLSEGDVDRLMQRLIAEEQKNKKPPLTAIMFYKWALGIIAIIVVWVLVF